MPQFPIPSGKRPGDIVALSPEDSRHAARVLRIRPGDPLRLFDRTGRFDGEVVAVSPRETRVLINKVLPVIPIKGSVTLAQALLKKDKMEWVIQKAVELGAAEFLPFTSERTVPTGDRSPIPRWQKIADEALKQCGRVEPVKVRPVTQFFDLLVKYKGNGEKIIFQRGEGGSPHFEKGGPGGIFLIGPEGGFSEKEIQMAIETGYRVCSMGNLILRSETAAITALALIQHELGNL